MFLERFQLDDQVAVVTGGTRGLGRIITLALAEAGANIAVVSRTPNPDVEKAVLALGRMYVHQVVDLTQREQTRKVVPTIMEKMGDINILVNNAGFIQRITPEDFPENDWDATLEINLTAAFILSQAAGRVMLQKRKGKIINVGSIASIRGGMHVAYTSSKHGIAGLTKCLANVWASKGINVNAIAPGFFLTDFTVPVQKDTVRSKLINSMIPAGRWGNPEDIAGAAVFLASPASDYLHGVVLSLDGGMSAR